MTFYSILYPSQEQHALPLSETQPECFKDLNLDQVFAPILKVKLKYELDSFFYTALQDPDAVKYRQEVMRELEDITLRQTLGAFSRDVYDLDRGMEAARLAISSSDSWNNNYLVRGRLLDYAVRFCKGVTMLGEGLSSRELVSPGLQGFAQYLLHYLASEGFQVLKARASKLRVDFDNLTYCMLIKGGTIKVRMYEDQEDLSARTLEIFDKFRQGEVTDYRHKFSEEPLALHVEAEVLNMLAQVSKDIFADLNDFCENYALFDDRAILRFSREIQFYLSWHEYIAPLRREGLSFCYPKLNDAPGHLHAIDFFDIALAASMPEEIVSNSYTLDDPERFIVITGPNQGGKTTFARALGQAFWLASLGLSIPGSEAALFLPDSILTHFGREEDLTSQDGKLQDDLMRLHDLLKSATSRSIIVINEIFSSTMLSDAIALSGKMMDTFAELGASGVIVTFLDEIARHGPETVSMMSTIREDEPDKRTFKVIRKPPDGLAYALHIAMQHGLTREQINRRLKGES